MAQNLACVPLGATCNGGLKGVMRPFRHMVYAPSIPDRRVQTGDTPRDAVMQTQFVFMRRTTARCPLSISLERHQTGFMIQWSLPLIRAKFRCQSETVWSKPCESESTKADQHDRQSALLLFNTITIPA